MDGPLEVVRGQDGVIRDIYNRPMVMVYSTRQAKPKKLKHKAKPTDDTLDGVQPLVFVNHDVSGSTGSNVDKERKKAIRIHVMRDYWRRERKFVSEPGRSERPNRTALARAVKDDEGLLLSAIPRMPQRGMDPFVKYPIEMQPRMHKLLHYYVTAVVHAADASAPRGGQGSSSSSELYSLALTDPASFYMILCSSSTYMGLCSGISESHESERYKLEAIQLLNRRLQDPKEAVSDVTISAVTSLAIIECVLGNYREWALHMDGLNHMIKIRGGLTALSKPLQIKISRADILGSVETDSKPCFPQVDDSEKKNYFNAEGSSPVSLYLGLENLLQSFNSTSKFVDILDDLQIITRTANQAFTSSLSNRPPEMDAAIKRICYRLLAYSSDIYITQSDAYEFVRLGLQIYEQTFVYGFPSCRIFCSLLMKKFQVYLDHISTTTTGREWPREFLLWLMFLGGIITPNTSTRTWFVARLSRINVGLKSHDWDSIKSLLEDEVLLDRENTPTAV